MICHLVRRKTKTGYVYYAKFMRNGRIERRSLKTSNRRVALRELAIIAESLGAPLNEPAHISALQSPLGVTTDISLVMLKKLFFESRKHDWRPNTYASYSSSWAVFEAYAGNLGITTLGGFTADVANRYREHLMASYAPTTAKQYLTAIKAVVRFARKRKWYVGDAPLLDTDAVPQEPVNRVWIRDDEHFEYLLGKAEEVGWPTYPMIALGLFAGFRVSEIRFAQWRWFDMTNDAIRLIPNEHWRPKNRRIDEIPLHPRLKSILAPFVGRPADYLFRRRDGVFYSIYFHLDQLSRAMGDAFPYHLNPHVLRHTFASRFLQRGGDIYTASKLLRHSRIATTQVYAHALPTVSDIAKI